MKDAFLNLSKGIDCHFTFRGNLHHVQSFNDDKGNLQAVIVDAETCPLILRNSMLDESEAISNDLQQGIPLAEVAKRYETGSSLEFVHGNPDVKLACSFWHASMQILKKQYQPDVPMAVHASKVQHPFTVYNGGRA